MDDYSAGENPMVVDEYWIKHNYDEEAERAKWAYLEDIAWEDEKDRQNGL